MISFLIKGLLFLSSGLIGKSVIDPNENKQNPQEVVIVFLEQKRKLTPLSEEEIFTELEKAYVLLYEKNPHENLLVGAWAHVALENGKGRKIWNYNFGNIGPLPNEKDVKFYNHFGKTKYRSFDDPTSGAIAYWKFLESCPLALKNFRYNDPRGAAISLKRCNYYRADQTHYSKLLTSLYGTGSRIARSRKSPR